MLVQPVSEEDKVLQLSWSEPNDLDLNYKMLVAFYSNESFESGSFLLCASNHRPSAMASMVTAK